MSSRPNFHYNSVTNRWELRGKGGKVLQAFSDAQADLGVDRMFTRIGSPAALTAIGSITVIGSIPVTGVRTGDAITANPLTALPAGVFIGGIRVSGNDNVNFYAGNLNNAVTGSLPAMGWRVVVMRAI